MAGNSIIISVPKRERKERRKIITTTTITTQTQTTINATRNKHALIINELVDKLIPTYITITNGVVAVFGKHKLFSFSFTLFNYIVIM